jgi:predicted secreted Zn-dependent protease
MICKFRHSLAACLLLAATVPTLAKDTSRTINYLVEGKSAAEVYDYIKRKAPRIAPNATFAFTTIATKTDKAETKGKEPCRYTRFGTSAIYGFYIPKHKSTKSLPGHTRSKWIGFAAYLQNHEEGHRAIWRECFKSYDEQALGLVAGNCSKLETDREKLFNRIKLECVKQDEAYDVLFRKEVVNTPFMRETQDRTR